jgi:hypothetical protein
MSANAQTIAIDLRAFGAVPRAYTHETRAATPQPPIVLPNAVFKWSHVHRVGARMPDELDVAARALLADLAASGTWDLSYGLNIALLHLSTTHAYLIAGVWRGHQELWERVWAFDLAAGGPLEPVATDGLDTPCACVWELGVICHERQAWQRYLFSARTEADKQAWLADVYAGPV